MPDTTRPSDERLAELLDRAEIIEVCTRMHWYLDRKAWDRYPEVFADEVSLPTLEEVRELAPGEAVRGRVRPLADVVASTKTLMDGLTTQHIVGGHHVDLRGETATCYANGVSMHIGSPQVAQNRVMHANAYEFELVRTPKGWRIRGINARPIWAEGNEMVCNNGARQAELLRQLDAAAR